jgi:hypothetical protein
MPLAMVFVLSRILPPRMLADFGGLYYLMVLLAIFYQWTLATEITLLLVGRPCGPANAAPSPFGRGKG